MSNRKNIYQVCNPYNGETVFLEKGGKLYGWATFCRTATGTTVEHLGWSNAPTAEAAVESAKHSYPYGTDYGAAPAKLVTAGDRDAYLARAERAKVNEAERKRWFDAIVKVAADYFMTDRESADALYLARQALEFTVDNAVYWLGKGAGIDSQTHATCRQRVMASAEIVGRWFKVVADDLDKSDRKGYTLGDLLRAEERIERKVARYLAERDALMVRLEAIPPF